MLELISHVVQISARRDRTEINSAMVDALLDLFHPQKLTIYRCYAGNKKAAERLGEVLAAAGLNEMGGRFFVPLSNVC